MKHFYYYSKTIQFFSLIFISLILFSCEKDADIDLKEMPPSIVVEAVFSDEADKSFVRLTQSKGFESTGIYEIITDAQVLIKDDQGNQIDFQIDADGVYKTTGVATENKNYHLEISKDSKRITATKTMLQKIVLQDFDFVYNDYDFQSRIILYFDDPSAEKDYFKMGIYRIDSNFSDGKIRILQSFFNDHTYDVQMHKIELPYMEYGSGTFEVTLSHIDKQTYDYFKTLEAIGEMDYGNSPFVSAVAGNPESTIQGGIGYFYVAGISSVQKTFQ